jgi:superfamily II DNA or RNA helicase
MVKLLETTSPNFLCDSSPAAGKTRFGLMAAHRFMTAGSIERLVVVVHTTPLREQWGTAAHEVGIDLAYDFENRTAEIPADCHGVVVTYAQVLTDPEFHRWGCAQASTLVILDEPHHMVEAEGLQKGWGPAAKQAFENAERRLLLTGTPFRPDRQPIPWVKYENRECVADYRYTYGQAVRDGVCRNLYFPTYEGHMTWKAGFTPEVSATFAEKLTEQGESYRLRTALLTEDWVRKMLEDAHRDLLRIRRTQYPHAAGLVFAMSQAHAKVIAGWLREISGHEPVIAISEDVLAFKKIRAFIKSTDLWLIAVRMVSEGVDIPRLSVGVYLSDIVKSEPYFRQAAFRHARAIKGYDDLEAIFYVPKDLRLLEWVETIKAERPNFIEEAKQKPIWDGPFDGPDGPDGPRPGNGFVPISAVPRVDEVIINGKPYIRDDLVQAEQLIALAGLDGMKLDDVVQLLRAQREHGIGQRADVPTPHPNDDAGESITVTEQKRQRRRAVTHSSRLFAWEAQLVDDGPNKDKYWQVGQLLIIATGVDIQHASLAQITERLEILGEWFEFARESLAGPYPYLFWEERAWQWRRDHDAGGSAAGE